MYRKILRDKLSIKVEKDQKQDSEKYCVTIFRGSRIVTLCGTDLDKLVDAAHAVKDVDTVTLRLPPTEKEVKISKTIEKKDLLKF